MSNKSCYIKGCKNKIFFYEYGIHTCKKHVTYEMSGHINRHVMAKLEEETMVPETLWYRKTEL